MVQWWDSAKIDATVTRQFVCRHLSSEETARLDQSLGFGGGLTDGTYWEWIDSKAKRLFLILVDLDLPGHIFNVIDNSWDDHDLPVALDQVGRMSLSPARDERIERKFFLRQFHYIMKPLQKGDHIAYLDNDVVPVELADRRPALVSSHTVDKVTLPNYPGQIFSRRRIPLGNSPASISYDEFQEGINGIKGIQNQHLVSYFASYVQNGMGSILFSPAADSNLKSFLSSTPSNFKNHPKKDRRHLVMNWMLCLVDALAYIHNRRNSHGNIKPSTILFTTQLHIFYSDYTRMSADALPGQQDKNSFDRESYIYAAPEQWFRPSTGPTSPGTRKATLSALSTSPQTHTNFSIPRNDNPSSPSAMLHSPNPQLNAQAADIFSLGCVLLEMIGFILKKGTKSFSTHRALKNKTPGRGGAVPDASFHKNLGQVESWMSTLAKEASKKVSDADGATVFRGVVPMLHIIAGMLSANPNDRPPADEIQERFYQILTQYCGIAEPHCVHRYGGWDFSMGQLRIQSPAPLDPTTMLTRQNTASSRLTRDSGSSGGLSHRLAGLAHSRTNSSGGMSNNSGVSSSASSERGQEPDLASSAGSISVSGTGFASLRNIRVPNVKTPGPWQASPTAAEASAVYAGQSGQASVY